MIEWKKFNAKTAGDEIEENDFLILTNGRIIQATHDAMNKYFSFPIHEGECVISYRHVTHYAEIDWPERPMIDWCEHGKMLVCEECAKRHQSTEYA